MHTAEHRGIVFAVHMATRKTHAPNDVDWKKAKKILRYFKGTVANELIYNCDETDDSQRNVIFECFSDDDYATDSADRKSASGVVVRMC